MGLNEDGQLGHSAHAQSVPVGSLQRASHPMHLLAYQNFVIKLFTGCPGEMRKQYEVYFTSAHVLCFAGATRSSYARASGPGCCWSSSHSLLDPVG